jgi:hypothetical protein
MLPVTVVTMVIPMFFAISYPRELLLLLTEPGGGGPARNGVGFPTAPFILYGKTGERFVSFLREKIKRVSAKPCAQNKGQTAQTFKGWKVARDCNKAQRLKETCYCSDVDKIGPGELKETRTLSSRSTRR